MDVSAKPRMKITDLKTTPLSIPFTRPTHWPYGVLAGITSILVEIETDGGLTGLGESVCLQDPAESTEQHIVACRHLLVGEDPFDTERLEKKLLGYGGWIFSPQGFGYTLGGIDMALWDIKAKACGVPLYKLLGGAIRRQIPFMKYLHHDTPDQMAEEAAAAVADGYQTLYFKYTTIEDLEAALRVVRSRVGPEPGFWVDFNQTLSAGFAVRLMPRLEELGVTIVEQPVLARDLDGMVYVKNSTKIQLLSHESSWTVADVFDVAARRAADIVSIEPRMSGSIQSAKKAAAICEAVGLPVLMHSIGELGVAQAAYLHVIASTPNFIVANQTMYDWLDDDIISGGKIPFANGCQSVPEGPGLGVRLDLDKVAFYSDNYRQAGKYSYFGGLVHRAEAQLSIPLLPSY